MKTNWRFLLLAISCFLEACGGTIEDRATQSMGGYLDSNYVSKSYRVAMDSIQHGSGVSPADFKLLQGFMRDFRDSIVGKPTYRDLLESAKGLSSMKDGAIEMEVKSINIRHDQKLVELRMVLDFKNKMNRAIGGFRADIALLNEKGDRITRTPAFSVMGPLGIDETRQGLRLEYTLYKPTGNELNDPRNQTKRDTLGLVEEMVKRKDLKSYKLRVLDVKLGNGLTPSQYWLKATDERASIDKLPPVAALKDRMQLIKWVSVNEPWITKLQPVGSEYTLLISPILTDHPEPSGDGKKLIFDRISKVQEFFNMTKHVPNSNINTGTAGKQLVIGEYLDYWNWPMEVRIYQQ